MIANTNTTVNDTTSTNTNTSIVVAQVMEHLISSVCFEESSTAVVDGDTCPICFDPITKNKNVCSTPCGHVFCFKCIVKCLNTSNTCPFCRTEINDKPVHDSDEEYNSEDDDGEEDDDITYWDDDEDDEDDEDENEEDPARDADAAAGEGGEAAPGAAAASASTEEEDEDDDECPIEYMETYFKEKGITYLNLMSMLLERYPRGMSRRMQRRNEKNIYTAQDFLDEEFYNQSNETKLMKLNDIRA
jgi:hypothetical protein